MAKRPAPEQLTQVEEHRLRARVTQLEQGNKRLIRDLSDAHRMLDYTRAVKAARAVSPIKPRERKSGLREGVALACASDWHIEEEVRPEQVSDRNRYNLEISAKRTQRFFEATRFGLDMSREAMTIRDLVLWLGGDLITNYLHDDNVETNLLSPVQAIARAQATISEGIDFLLGDKQLDRVIIPCNDGNHGRLTEKKRAAARIENSIEWLLYTMLAREWKSEPRVQFQIATGIHTYLDIYGRDVRFTHGDAIRYGGGVGGITIPIYKALARWDTVRRADLTVMGHWHQRTALRRLIINGSLIGYNAYAMEIGAEFEPPQQHFHVFESKRFDSISMPLWVGDRDDDQGARHAP